MSGGTWLRVAALLLALLVLGTATITARVILDGERALKESDAAFDRGDVEAAALYAQRAAVLYAPGAPHVAPAYERLIAIARGAEAAGEQELAAKTWQTVRGAALETRHLWVPRRAELELANENIARLQVPVGSPLEAAREVVVTARSELVRDDAPRAPWIALLALGFSLAGLGLGAVAVRGVTPDGELVWSTLRAGGVAFLVGVVCWTIAVLQA